VFREVSAWFNSLGSWRGHGSSMQVLEETCLAKIPECWPELQKPEK
jgi:hypothetical protein